MSHWGLFTNSFGKMLHPVLWVYSLLIVLATSNLGVLFLFNEQTLRNLSKATTFQALQTSLTPIFVILIVLGVIGFVFATFGGAALIYLINQLELRERATLGKGLDAGEKIFQLLIVRMILILPNLLVVVLAFAVMWGQLSRVTLTLSARTNPLSGLFGGVCGLMAIAFVVNLLTSALSVGAERAIVIEKMSIGQALGLSGKLLATQLSDLIIIGLIFLGLSLLVGIFFSCVGQPLLSLMFSGASPSAMLGGSLLTNPIVVLSISVGLIGNMLATILGTSVWTLAYRQWRADQLPALLADDFA
jgi:hypothetical protein